MIAIAREVVDHGSTGYRRGCKCGVCREAHRVAVAAWRVEKRRRDLEQKQLVEAGESAPVVVPESAPLASMPSLDLAADPGHIESVLAGELAALVGKPPWLGTLSALARYNARALDQMPRLDRLDLVSPLQIRLFEVLDRLRAVSGGGEGLAAQTEAFLKDMATPDGPAD